MQEDMRQEMFFQVKYVRFCLAHRLHRSLAANQSTEDKTRRERTFKLLMKGTASEICVSGTSMKQVPLRGSGRILVLADEVQLPATEGKFNKFCECS